MNAPRPSGAEYRVGDAIKGRWTIRSICGGRGKSGMGIVYIVDDILNHETLAAKTLQPHLVAEPAVRKLLQEEANHWLKMGRHPNIVALDYVDAPGTQIYLFMEYIAPDDEGRNSLRQFLTETSLTDATVARWSIQMCRALAHMNACGIVAHRDLKPDNIMIDRDGDVRITDFGLAKAYAGAQSFTAADTERLPTTTRIGQIAGTPGYMAPEIVLGEDAGVRSDIYAFGLILAQMLTGNRWAPFTGEWRGNAIAYENANLRIRERLHNPLPRAAFAAVLNRCLEYDAQQRYTSFTEIENALTAIANSRELPIPPAPTQRQTQTLAQTADLNPIIALYGLGRLQEALTQLRERTKGLPVRWEYLTNEGTLLADLGHFAQAIPLLQKACELKPDWCGVWINLGRALRATTRSAEAIDAYDRSLAIDPSQADAWTSKGNCLFDLERFEEALRAYDKAITLDPYFWAAQLGRGKALARLGCDVEALAALDLVFEVEPDSAEARTAFDQTLATLERKPAQRSTLEAIIYSNECYRRGAYEEGLKVVREARFRHATDSSLGNNEAVFLIEQQDYRGALRCLDRALAANPDDTSAWSNKGRAYRRLQQLQDALHCHERATQLEPEDPGLWSNRYAVYMDLELMDEARACFRNACKHAKSFDHRERLRNQADDLYYLTLAETAYQNKDYDEAHRCAASVTESSRWWPEAKLLLARSRFFIATQFCEKDIADRANGFAEVIRVLELAKEGLSDPEEIQTIVKQLDMTVSAYLNASFGRLAKEGGGEGAEALLAAAIQYAQSDDLKVWARQQLAVLITNRAVRHINWSNEARQALIDRIQRAAN